MNKRTLILVGTLLALLCVGMVVYTILVTSEQQTTNTNSGLADTEESVSAEKPQLLSGQSFTESFRLPLAGSAPTANLIHTIPLEEIRRGCFRQDCIPSVDNPTFVPASELVTVLESESLGIFIPEANRFYPFPMLETREIVNDTFPDGTAAAVTYCPLCGTGIVFLRELEDGTVTEFGVSGMLWQSNLLMYNRAENETDRNLWSQVLGQAVVGDRAGEELDIIPSDVITFADWLEQSPEGMTLTTGSPQDPYDGDYFGTAQFFRPDFDANTSALPPMTRVHGIIVNGQPKAYVSDQLFNDFTDIVAGERVFVEQTDGSIRFITSNAELGQAPTQIPDIEGFWFSWAAAHPDTLLWTGE